MFPIANTFLFLFSNELLVIRAGKHKMLVRIANREDLNQTALVLHCLSRPFWLVISFQNFRKYTVFSTQFCSLFLVDNSTIILPKSTDSIQRTRLRPEFFIR